MSTITSPNADPILSYTNLPLGEQQEKPLFGGLTAGAWVKILIVAALLVALFRFNLARLWLKTNPFTGDANWGHTTIIPIIGLYYLYLNRERLLAARVKPIFFERISRVRFIVSVSSIVGGALLYVASISFLGSLFSSEIISTFVGTFGEAAIVWGALMLVLGWGIGNLVFGLFTFAFGIYPGRNDWVCDYGMVHTLFGIVLTLCGWEVMRVAWFPIAFLLCGLPWPGLVYSWLANPLQHLAARIAVKTLNLTGIEAMRSGTKMFIFGSKGQLRPMNVAEACAGLRSLMTFISVAAAVAFLSQRAFWQKVVITASAVPIAIFCNVMRVTGQAYLDRFAGEQWSEGFAHQFVGLVMLIPAFFLILLVAWMVDQLVVEEVDDKAKWKSASAAARRTGEKKIIVPQNRIAPASAAAKTVTTAAASPSPAVKPVAQAPVQGIPPKSIAPAPPKPAPSGSPTGPTGAKAPSAMRLPPRTNLTGRSAPTPPPTPTPKPSSSAQDRPVEGA